MQTDLALDTLWPKLSESLRNGEELRLSACIEEALALGIPNEEAGIFQELLLGRLLRDGFQEVARGIWLSKDAILPAPALLRLPTVRKGQGGITLIEAREGWEKACEEEGIGEFTKRLAYREIVGGFLKLSEAAAKLFPETTTRLSLSREEGESTAWFCRTPFPMLYGLEDWLGVLDPGTRLRIVRVERDRFAVKVLENFDEAFYRSESRLFDLDALYNLRRFGMTYRQHLKSFLADCPEGATVKKIIDELEKRLNFRPNPATIRAALSSGEEFLCNAGKWTFLPQTEAIPEAPELSIWYEENGAMLRLYQPYRALLMTVGTSLEPLRYSLRFLRPEGVCFLVTKDSEKQVDELMSATPVPPAWKELVRIEDFEDLFSCQNAAHEGLSRILSQGIPSRQILVDFTGGTKAMSVGAVLATRTEGCAYGYVGGNSRDMSRRGIVIDGSERMRVVV